MTSITRVGGGRIANARVLLGRYVTRTAGRPDSQRAAADWRHDTLRSTVCTLPQNGTPIISHATTSRYFFIRMLSQWATQQTFDIGNNNKIYYMCMYIPTSCPKHDTSDWQWR